MHVPKVANLTVGCSNSSGESVSKLETKEQCAKRVIGHMRSMIPKLAR
jgi:hypothetical protein